MVTEALPIDRIVRVNAAIAPSTPLRPVFGRTLLITTEGDHLRPPARTASYSDAASVGEAFGTGSSVYARAVEYFGQGVNAKDLIVGRWADSSENAQILGGRHSTLAALNLITAGTITISGQTSGSISLSSAVSLTSAASVVQTSIRAITNPTAWSNTTAYVTGDDVSGTDGQIYNAVQGNTGNDPVSDDGTNWELLGPQVDAATVTYDTTTNRFVITNDSDFVIPFPRGTIADGLGLTAALGAATYAGYAADLDIAEAFNDMVRLDGSFYWVGHDTTINDYSDGGDLETLAAAVQASNRYQLDLNSYGDDPLTTNETTSFDARIGALVQNRVNRNWNGTADESIGFGIAAMMSSVNFSGVNTLINPHGRPLKGFTPGRLTEAEANELIRKRVNFFATIGPQAIYTRGTTGAPGIWRDSQYFLDWLTEEVQIRVYNHIINNPTRVPQTDDGLQGVLSVIEQACRQGVRNGGISPGFVSSTFRTSIQRFLPEFSGHMPRGFLVYALPFSTLSDADLRERKSPSPRVWIRGSGAINSIEIDMTFDG